MPVQRYPVKLRFHNLQQNFAELVGDTEPPFAGVLTGDHAEVHENIPGAEDKALFERYRQPQKEVLPKTRRQASDTASEIKTLHIGNYSMATRYNAPYPAEYTQSESISVCEICLKYMRNEFVSRRHRIKCPMTHPPGNEIYRDGKFSIWEVDGTEDPNYCQNLCLLAKLFLDSKTLYYDVEPFLFYVLTVTDSNGPSFAGYFSKQKLFAGIQNTPINNVSCIMTLPLPEYKGLGQYLISFSYLLTRLQKTTGSPERPLSKLGQQTYENYWKLAVAYAFKSLLDKGDTIISIQELSVQSGMTHNDVVYGLEILGWIKGGRLVVNKPQCLEIIAKWEQRNFPAINPDCLVWSP